MTADKAFTYAGWLYLLIGVITFGDAAAYLGKKDEVKVSECVARGGKSCFLLDSSAERAIASSIVWPLYLSYRFFDNKEFCK